MNELERNIYKQIIEHQRLAIEANENADSVCWYLVVFLIVFNILSLSFFAILNNSDYIYNKYQSIIDWINKLKAKFRNE